jgi:mannose-6-phosphate isomerase-like protein (cupin superfamily)
MSTTTAKGYNVKAIDEMAALHGGAVKLAGAELGVESFGIQVLDFPAGFEHYPEHDHSQDGQEEVYIMLRGSAEFEIDGERVAVEPGRMLWVGAESKRKLLPTAQDVRILALGCTPGKPYERPEDFRLAVKS